MTKRKTTKPSASSMNAYDRVWAYLFRNQQRNPGFFATAREISKFARVNYNTVRRILGEWVDQDVAASMPDVRCRVTKRNLTGYGLLM